MAKCVVRGSEAADERLPILTDLPFRLRGFMAARLIGALDVERYLDSGVIEQSIAESAATCAMCNQALIGCNVRRMRVVVSGVESWMGSMGNKGEILLRHRGSRSG